ncbi:MAG: proline--tRNA ligase [bacterium]|nr:proline--tRNA ligase [bacterium]
MRWSNLFVPTLREAPAEAEVASHQLLLRAGFIRQLHSGHYSLLPLGLRVHDKVADVVREEMDAIGAQELLLPAMHPAWVWEQSGRWTAMGDEMFRLTDRKGADVALGMTHEEVIAFHAREIHSYREVPQIWYQIQWKFRDEPRPKSGLLRVREFAMKDSYSLDIDDAGLDHAFDLHHKAYTRIFERMGLPAIAVEASSGAMGGSASVEFMVPSAAGEDDIVRCQNCGYAANVERAVAVVPPVADPPGGVLEQFPTPGIRTIAALAAAEAEAPPHRQIKTMVYALDGQITLVLLRGDHELSEQKLLDNTGASTVRPAGAEECVAALGASPGSLGAVGVSDLPVLADGALAGRSNLTTGANVDDFHYRGVDIERDIVVSEWLDLRQVRHGEPCTRCGKPLELLRCIETGHIFKLGRRYAEAFETTVMDADGAPRTLTMGSYGIGIGRAVAAVAETHHDERGLCWPVSVAPYEVAVVPLADRDGTVGEVAERLYDELRDLGVEVIIDDRDARPGVKFSDIELVGIPYRVTVGPRGLANDEVELTERATGETINVGIAEAAARVRAARDAALTAL